MWQRDEADTHADDPTSFRVGRATAPRRLRVRPLLVVLVLTALGTILPDGFVGASAPPTTDTTGTTDTDETTPAVDPEVLELGVVTYTANCASCHQAGGRGLAGSFPPLNGNEHVQDTEYVRGVLANGRTGELVVAGQTYNGTMPAFSLLSADEIDAVIAYLQSGFSSGSAGAPTVQPAAAPGLPNPVHRRLAWAVVILAGFVALIAPGLRPIADGERLTWAQGWARASVIVVATVVLVVVIPALVLDSRLVQRFGPLTRDLIGTGMWALGLGAVFVVLHRLHRRRQI